jgi:hypothetical protein
MNSGFFDLFVFHPFGLFVRPYFTQLSLQILDSYLYLFLSQFELVLFCSEHHDWLELGFFFVGTTSFFLLGFVFELLLGFRVSLSFGLNLGFGFFIEGDFVQVNEAMGIFLF